MGCFWSHVGGISELCWVNFLKLYHLSNIFFEGSTWDKKIQTNEEEVRLMLKNGVALQKFGTTEDVANLVSFLISSGSSFATGSIWTLDGGQI